MHSIPRTDSHLRPPHDSRGPYGRAHRRGACSQWAAEHGIRPRRRMAFGSAASRSEGEWSNRIHGRLATTLKEGDRSVREKMDFASEVKVQFDNAGGHGMNTLDKKIAAELPAPSDGGPKLTMVPQPAQSPDTNGCAPGLFQFGRLAPAQAPPIRSRRVLPADRGGARGLP